MGIADSQGKRGKFVVLEGPDGAGISTQTALLQAALSARGFRAVATKEPTSGPIGSVIRQALAHRLVYPGGRSLDNDVMALLFAADRLDHIQADILPRLDAGTHVICDRYRLSSYAYQGLTLGQEWVHAINNRSISPDITFFIDVPPEVSQQRIVTRGGHIEMYETEERLRPVYNNYLSLIKELQAEGQNIISIDGTLSVDAVSAAIMESTLALLHNGSRGGR